jgi:amino acid permease
MFKMTGSTSQSSQLEDDKQKNTSLSAAAQPPRAKAFWANFFSGVSEENATQRGMKSRHLMMIGVCTS